jgi:2-hydroxychromene-2-carboxylate isomerase
MLRSTCRGSDRLDECHQAVSSAVIRRVWASLSRTDDPAGKAEHLLALGDDLALTPLQVTNSIRAELDEELTRAVHRGAMGWRRRDAAITCFDAPERCAPR